MLSEPHNTIWSAKLNPSIIPHTEKKCNQSKKTNDEAPTLHKGDPATEMALIVHQHLQRLATHLRPASSEKHYGQKHSSDADISVCLILFNEAKFSLRVALWRWLVPTGGL